MTAAELVALVRKLRPPFLEDLTASEIAAIVSTARQRRFLANSVMTNQGHPASHIYMVLSGSARSFFLTESGQKLYIHWYPPGDMFGGITLVARSSMYLVSTEAIKNTNTLVWDRLTIRTLAIRYPKLFDNALSIATNYMNLSIATRVSLTCHTARQRLAVVVANLASGIGHEVPGGVELAVRNEELAAAANMTAFTVSRIVSEWERCKMVKKTRGKVIVRSPELLLLHEI